MNNLRKAPAGYITHGGAAQGIELVSRIRRFQEELAERGPELVPQLMEGLIALGGATLKKLQSQISKMLGYDAGGIVLEVLEAFEADEWDRGRWRRQVSGTYVLL